MAVSKKRNLQDIRHLHRTLAPIMLLPLLLTLLTGTIYQIFDLLGQPGSASWLLEWHKGHFGALNLEFIYPFLNALGLLTLLVTGITMWLRMRRNPSRRSS
jgi:hypothetical protein